MIFNYDISYLNYFLVLIFFVWGKAKAIGANNSTRMKYTITSYLGFVIKFNPRINFSVFSYFTSFVKMTIRRYLNVISYYYIFTNVSERSNIYRLANLSSFVNKYWFFNSCFGSIDIFVKV
ncbi:MAG: Uncharacterised protein [Crocinitomicaceae bacterium]|nr:MAG: Uncharacterised protein [Crocinitomicaceae bacterium]